MKTKHQIDELIEPTKNIKPGVMFRLKSYQGFRVWMITGIHLGGSETEDIVTIKPADRINGSAYGKEIKEMTCPMWIIQTNREIEWL